MPSEKVAKALNGIAWSGVNAAARGGRPITLYQERDAYGHAEYVRHLAGSAVVEEEHGYILNGSGKLLLDSVQPNIEHKASWRIALPSVVTAGRARRLLRRSVPRGPAISLRHWWEWNYFHFTFDVLGKLELFDRVGLDEDVPLLVGGYVDDVPFARDMMKCGEFSHRRWVVQERSDGLLPLSEVWWGRTRSSFFNRGSYVARKLFPHARASGDTSLRVFVNRRNAATRRILNMNDVQGCLRDFGFSEVDFGAMRFWEQAEVMRNCRYLVGVHGAGLTNMIYRTDQPLSVLELYASNYNSFDFRTLCMEAGYAWSGLPSKPGGGRPQHADFTVDIGALQLNLEMLLHPKPSSQTAPSGAV